MKKPLMTIIAVICILAAVLVYFTIAHRPKPSDEEQIFALLVKGKSAIEHKDAKGVLSCLSSDYSDNAGFTRETLYFQAIDAFQVKGEYVVQFQIRRLRVLQRMAYAETQVSVALVSADGRRKEIFSGPIDIILLKEKTRRWLIVPTTSWKASNISGTWSGLEE